MTTKDGTKNYILAFEGIDGSGKSSIASLLYAKLQSRGVKVALVATRGAAVGPLVLPRRTPTRTEESLSQLARLLWPADGAEHHHELGYGYWLGLAGAYFNGLEYALLPELRAKFDAVIVENWCFKFAAKLALKGYSGAALEEALPLQACLDAVLLIDTPPAKAWQRKRCFSVVELGGQDGYQSLGRESFIDYQSRVRQRLLQFAGENWTRVENAGGIDEVCGRLEAMLLPRLAAAEGKVEA